MLYEIREQFSIDLIPDEVGTHISLYQPTHRHSPQNQKDPIVFKNLLKEIANSLKQNNDKRFIDSIMKPFYDLENDRDFWNNAYDGIAVLANENKCLVYKLKGKVKELAVVSSSFHIKPLIKAFQAFEDYQLLAISQDNFSIYEGNRLGFEEIEIDPEIPRTLEDLLGEELSQHTLTHGSFDRSGKPGVFYGVGDNEGEKRKALEKYFRYVDQYINDNHSKISKLPLILVSLKEYQAPFKRLSKNIYIMDESISTPYDLANSKQVQDKVVDIIENLNLKEVEKTVETYKKQEASSMGTSDLAQAAKAAYEGRIDTILIEENRIVPGKIIKDNGNIEFGELGNPELGDILNDLAKLVLNSGGKTKILSKDKMPTTTGIAAIYRYN